MLKHTILLKKSLYLPFTITLICVTVLGLGILPSGTGGPILHPKQIHITSTKSAQSPVISIQPQPNVPLIVLTVRNDSTTIHNPEFDLVVMNTSAKSIRAYAIRYDTVSAQSKSGGLELTNKESHSSVLQPGRSETIDINGGSYQADALNSITVSIDFVEFEDGSTWGPDTYKSAERLDGLRTGARAAVQHLLRILKASGPAAVFDILETEAINMPIGTAHSSQWLDGFQEGVNFIKGRLKQNSKNHSAAEIDSVLRRPVDASNRLTK